MCILGMFLGSVNVNERNERFVSYDSTILVDKKGRMEAEIQLTARYGLYTNTHTQI
jgi:hypothetical protein